MLRHLTIVIEVKDAYCPLCENTCIVNYMDFDNLVMFGLSDGGEIPASKGVCPICTNLN